ncbi:MAG TPA: glycosyltransferase [Roseiflexaceae bacterium]|nr:glycosyltransferase [Roseiflexaceae bacterium]
MTTTIVRSIAGNDRTLIRKPRRARPAAPTTAAIIPAYNEERFIGSLVLATRSYVSQVIVVDDGSSDRTAEIAERAGAIVIRHSANQGKAAAVNSGFSFARQQQYAAVVMLDGDGQHRPDDIPALLEPVLLGEADIVVGSRFLGVRSAIPSYRKVGQHGLTLVTNLASGVSVSDSQSGYRAFSTRALAALSFGQEGFTIESEMQFLAHQHGLRIAEVPVTMIYAERAKRNPVRHGMQVLRGILRLVGQKRPLFFFGTTGLLCMLTGLALGVYMLDIYLATRQLAVGYGLITVLLCVVGMLQLFIGVVLHSVRNMIFDLHRCVFERLDTAERRSR